MGTWFVIAVKPTYFERTCSNAVEKYTSLFGEESSSNGIDIDIDFQYNQDEDPLTSKLKSLPQSGWVEGKDKKNSGLWKVSPFRPIKMPYIIIELDKDKYDYCVIGYPSRAYVWILSRKPKMEESTYSMLTDRIVSKHQYDLEGLRKVPQIWTKEEREKRGLTKDEVPDKYLKK